MLFSEKMATCLSVQMVTSDFFVEAELWSSLVTVKTDQEHCAGATKEYIKWNRRGGSRWNNDVIAMQALQWTCSTTEEEADPGVLGKFLEKEMLQRISGRAGGTRGGRANQNWMETSDMWPILYWEKWYVAYTLLGEVICGLYSTGRDGISQVSCSKMCTKSDASLMAG